MVLASLLGTGGLTDMSARVELFEKTVRDALSVKELYHLLHRAVATMDSTFVDRAWGIYTGAR
jgi:hypothetical protein